MDKKNIVATFWSINSSLVIKIAVGIVLLVVLVFVGNWWAGRSANALAERLRQEFQIENRALYDNLAVLKDRTQQLEYQYGFQKNELAVIRNKQKGGASDAFNNPDKKVAASYFDNVIDSYISSN
jgi:hypothetical protein